LTTPHAGNLAASISANGTLSYYRNQVHKFSYAVQIEDGQKNIVVLIPAYLEYLTGIAVESGVDSGPPPLRWAGLRYDLSHLELPVFLAQVPCKFSDCDSAIGEGLVRQATQGRKRSIVVVVAPPTLDALTRIRQRLEPRGIQAIRS
jgi:hypothetical protein